MTCSTFLKLTLPLLIILSSSPYCEAHKLRIFAWEENGIIKTETQFNSGRPAKHATVTVISKQDQQVLLSGTTDDSGLFNFSVPETAKKNRCNLEIIASSGDGHKNSWHLDAMDYLQEVTEKPAQSLPLPVPEPQRPVNQNELQKCVVDGKQLTAIIESTLEKKLAPIKRSLARQQEKKTSLQDILGGIGYILGLAGIATYFKSRKTKN